MTFDDDDARTFADFFNDWRVTEDDARGARRSSKLSLLAPISTSAMFSQYH